VTMLAVCTPSIALTLIVPPVSVVRSSDVSVTACALPVLVTVLVTVWMPLVNVTAGARFVAQGLRQEGFRADSISRHGRAAVMTMGISEHAFIMMTWFAKNFGRYGCQFRWSALMPTLSKEQLTGPDSPWGAAFDQMYLGLCRDRVSILTALGFYAEHDLPPPEENPDANPTTNEEEELRQIASALTVAAAASAAMPAGVLAATLLKVSKNPGLFFTRDLPAPVEWAIACDYQRADEPPGTHWRDVWGDQVAAFPGEIEQPTELNIAKAAGATSERIQKTRKAGRPYNQADQILADQLGEIFRRSGQPIRRRRVPVMRRDEVADVEGGPIYDFIELVLKPLRVYLHERHLAPVTTETIVRRITDDFPKTD